MSITIKAIDILKEHHKYQVREIHGDGNGQTYKNHGKALYSDVLALRRALRHKNNLAVRVEFLGIVEAAE